jgi:WD40 repeat protein
LWDVATGSEIVRFGGHQEGVYSVAFSPDGKHLATGSNDGTARLWDVAAGSELVRFGGHQEGVKSVAFSPDGKHLATGSNDGTARLWPLGQLQIDLACARVHELPLSDRDKERFGIEDEWCTPEVSGALRVKLGLDQRPAGNSSPNTASDSAR